MCAPMGVHMKFLWDLIHHALASFQYEQIGMFGEGHGNGIITQVPFYQKIINVYIVRE
jgi:hypothetical protein